MVATNWGKRENRFMTISCVPAERKGSDGEVLERVLRRADAQVPCQLPLPGPQHRSAPGGDQTTRTTPVPTPAHVTRGNAQQPFPSQLEVTMRVEIHLIHDDRRIPHSSKTQPLQSSEHCATARSLRAHRSIQRQPRDMRRGLRGIACSQSRRSEGKHRAGQGPHGRSRCGVPAAGDEKGGPGHLRIDHLAKHAGRGQPDADARLFSSPSFSVPCLALMGCREEDAVIVRGRGQSTSLFGNSAETTF
jgi:hypothetical protein